MSRFPRVLDPVVSARGDVLSAFFQGLTRPSLLSLGIAALVIVSIVAAGFCLITPDLMAGNAIGYFARSSRDDDAFVTSRVLALARSTDQRPLVAIIGASATRESFGSGDDLAKTIREVTGVDAEVEILATGRQGPLEHAAILDAIRSPRPTIVVIGVGPSRFTGSAAELAESQTKPRLGFRADVLNDEARRLGFPLFVPSGIYALDNMSFVIPRIPAFLLNTAFRGPQGQKEHRYTGKMPEKQFDAQRNRIRQRLNHYEENFSMNKGIFDRIIARNMVPKRFAIILVEAPINPDFLDSEHLNMFYEEHVSRMIDLATELGVPYWTLAMDVGIQSSDFYDWTHVNNLDTKSRLRTELVERIALTLETMQADHVSAH
jgi:hypothetical protein